MQNSVHVIPEPRPDIQLRNWQIVGGQTSKVDRPDKRRNLKGSVPLDSSLNNQRAEVHTGSHGAVIAKLQPVSLRTQRKHLE